MGFIELPRCVAIKQIVEYPFGFGFSLIGKSCRRYVFSVETLEAAQAWTQAITKAMISVQPNSCKLQPHSSNRASSDLMLALRQLGLSRELMNVKGSEVSSGADHGLIDN